MTAGWGSRSRNGSRRVAPVLLATVLLVAAACKEVVREPAPTAAADPLAALLPAPGALPGWDRATAAELYGPDNLWEYIDGQAELYLGYGFQRVATSELASSSDGSAVAVEIYQMATPEDAFGIFAAERTGDERPVEIGVQGYAAANVLNFWQGPYYVRLTSFTELPGVEQAMADLAQRIAAEIGGARALPRLLAVLPEEHRVPASERYIPSSFLGQPYLNRAYRVDYDRDGARYQLVLLDCTTPEEAVAVLDSYGRFLESEGARVSRDQQDGETSLRAQGAGVSLLFQSGRLIGGVVGIADPGLAEQVVEELRARCRLALAPDGLGSPAAGSGPSP